MPTEQHVNPAEEPAPATTGIWIQPPLMRIGRHPDNDVIVADPGVSEQHAELRRTAPGHYTVIDVGSRGGTYVNGTRVSRRELEEGDIVAIGSVTFRLAGSELIVHDGDGPASR
jgi:pSer/pThr/pTyr-binding forkhead associated (FHA) protein